MWVRGCLSLCVVVSGHICLCIALVWLCVGAYTGLYVCQYCVSWSQGYLEFIAGLATA